LKRFAEYFGLNEKRVVELLPARKVHWSFNETSGVDQSGFEGFFSDMNEVEMFLSGIHDVTTVKINEG
jgi:hypothetical protein